MSFTEYAQYDALGLAALIAKKKVSAREVMDEAIARAEALNPKLNAIVFMDADGGRAAARGKLTTGAFGGVPMLLKDMRANVAGWPTRSGSRMVPATGAAVQSNTVTNFKAAGLIPFGKTNVPEFGILPTTECKLYGPAHNPWNLEHSPGGSSGGSAAAVAAGIVPIAHATDGGGSIRIPASACGLVGLKATRGRVSQGPEAADATSGLSMDGVVTKSVRDTAAALDALGRVDYGDPYWAPPPEGSYLEGIRRKPKRLRIALSTKMMNGTAHDPEVTAAVKKAAKLCESLGHIVEERDPPIDASGLVNAFSTVWCANVAYQLDMLEQQTGIAPSLQVVEGLTLGLYKMGKLVSAVALTQARQTMMREGRKLAAWYETTDVWLTATLGRPPMKLGTLNVDETDVQKGFAPNFGYVPFTSMQNSTGTPGINLPLYWSKDGLPLGVQFCARAGGEMTLLKLAAELEKASPWAQRYSQVRIYMAFAEYTDYDGLGLAHLVRKGEVSPLELLEEAIARSEKNNPRLNAIVYKAYDEARAVAKGKLPDGPFKGVPFLIKDISMAVANWPMTNGSKLLEGYVSPQDAELTKRYRASGMVLYGKTNTPEFGIPGTTEGRFLGSAHNPWNLNHSTGGSSGGAAAAVAAGIVPMAHASDGLGSIRIPAAQCGLFGMKPTQFRNPGGPDDRGRAHGMIVDHVVTRTVRDSAAMLDWTGYPEDDAPYAPAPKARPYMDEIATLPGRLRIGFCTETVQGQPLHPDVQKTFDATVKLCESLGHTMIDVPTLGVRLRRLYKAQGFVSGAVGIVGYEEWAEKMGRPIDESTVEWLTLVGYRGAKETSPKDVAWGLQTIRQIGRQILALYRQFDVLLQPIQISPAPPLGFLDTMKVRAREFNMRQGQIYGLTPLANLTGQPAMSMPMAISPENNLPVSMMFSGRYGDEATLFRLAAQIEQAQPWIDRKPPIWN